MVEAQTEEMELHLSPREVLPAQVGREVSALPAVQFDSALRDMPLQPEGKEVQVPHLAYASPVPDAKGR